MERKSFFLLLDEWLKSRPKTSPPKNTYPQTEMNWAKINKTPINTKPYKTGNPDNPSTERISSQEITSAEKSKRMIFVCYCAAIICSVMFVPWRFEGYNHQGMKVYLDQGYHFIFSASDYASINFAVIFLEIVAITAIAAIAYVFRDTLCKLFKTDKII